MSFNFKLPNIVGSTKEAQIEQIKSFLRMHIDELQFALSVIENNVDKSTKTEEPIRPSAVRLSDTGWVSLDLDESIEEGERANGRNGSGCYYRVVGENHVYIAFNCSFTYNGTEVVVNKNTLPEKYRPAHAICSICPTGGRNLARALVDQSGNIYVEWVQNIASASNTTASTVAWVDGYLDYWI